jgi:hypothetical protein
MKLTFEKLESVLEQINAEVIPDDHPSLPKLRDLFGDHTFFVNDSGLIIVEPLGTRARDRRVGQTCKLG